MGRALGPGGLAQSGPTDRDEISVPAVQHLLRILAVGDQTDGGHGEVRGLADGAGEPHLVLRPDGEDAQQVLDRGDADFVAIGRAALREPAWPQRAAHELGVRDPALYPGPYRRGSW